MNHNPVATAKTAMRNAGYDADAFNGSVQGSKVNGDIELYVYCRPYLDKVITFKVKTRQPHMELYPHHLEIPLTADNLPAQLLQVETQLYQLASLLLTQPSTGNG